MSLVPDIDASVATWLLPALAVTLVLLVLLTRLSAVVAVGIVAVAWLLARSPPSGPATSCRR